MKLLFTILTLLMSLLGYGQITSRNANEVIPRSIRSLGDRIPQVDVLPSVPNLLQYTGDAASGAFVYCRCTADTSKRGVYYWEVNQWVRLTSGDVSFLITDFDSTGQLRGRLLFSGRNYKVVSSPRLLVDSINSKVVINNSNVSVGGPQTKLFVGGNIAATDTVKGYALQVNGITELEDTTTAKPVIVDEDGNVFRLKYWSMVGIGGGGLTYPNTANKYLNGYGNFVTLNSDSLTEGSTNQFFTNARARAAISLTTTGTSGAATYNSSTGVLNIPNYAGGGGGVTTVGTFSGSSQPNGATVSGSTITFGPADATNPGMVSTGAQTWAGNKTMTGIQRFTSGNSQAAIHLSDGGSAGQRTGMGSYGTGRFDMFTRDGYEFYWYFGGDYVPGFVVPKMSLSSTALSLGAGVELNLSSTLKTAGYNGNSLVESIQLRNTGSTNKIILGKYDTRMDFITPSGGQWVWHNNGYSIDVVVDPTMYLTRSAGLHVTPLNAFNIPTSAAFSVYNTSKGSMPFTLHTTTQRTSISSPANGLFSYDTDKKQNHYYDGSTWQAQVGMTFGTAAPTGTPTAVGNFFLDTTNKKLYVATGIASSADWNILN